MAIVLLAAFAAPASVSAAAGPQVHAAAHILIEVETGRVISENDAHRRMFPAATTMLLTAILGYEHIGMDEILIAGNEVHNLPQGSARNFHEAGEAITGINLLRGMLIGRGNDTANVVVWEVARRTSGNENISFANAQVVFANLMTQRARELGALDSSFVNPHGYHHDSHFTTAYDMAQIALHALSIPTIADIVSQYTFFGPMWGGDETAVPEGATMLSRRWYSVNELLFEDGEHYYPYAIGLRAGWTSQAGYSLVAAAARDDITLVSVTFNSPEIPMEPEYGAQYVAANEIEYAPTRWQDNINLFEYGFRNFANRVFLEAGAVVGELPVQDPRIDDPGYLEFYSTPMGMMFLSIAEMSRLEREVAFVADVVIYDEEYGQMFVAPIYEGDVVGTVSFHLDGEMVFSTDIYASRYVPVRTTVSDIELFMERVNEIFFSAASIPYWIAGVSVLILAAVLITMARRAKRRRRNNYKYKWKY